MLKLCAKAGIRPAEFWEMTPAELAISIEAEVETRTEALKERITVAYLNASWQRAKKMPRLETIISKLDRSPNTARKKKQTPEEMYAIAEAMTERLNKAR